MDTRIVAQYPVFDWSDLIKSRTVNSMNNFKTFLENGRVVKFGNVFELSEERVNSVVTKATMIMQGLSNTRC